MKCILNIKMERLSILKLYKKYGLQKCKPYLKKGEMRKMREYFKNVKAEVGEVINPSKLELIIPEGFTKQLNDREKECLLADQLIQKGLMLDTLAINGASRIVTASKGVMRQKPLSECFVSKRLSEYLEKFNANA